MWTLLTIRVRSRTGVLSEGCHLAEAPIGSDREDGHGPRSVVRHGQSGPVGIDADVAGVVTRGGSAVERNEVDVAGTPIDPKRVHGARHTVCGETCLPNGVEVPAPWVSAQERRVVHAGPRT